MTIYIALLRGINVGGKNIIKMVDLRRVFEAMGLSEVQTYIQSGNVLFKSKVEKFFIYFVIVFGIPSLQVIFRS